MTYSLTDSTGELHRLHTLVGATSPRDAIGSFTDSKVNVDDHHASMEPHMVTQAEYIKGEDDDIKPYRAASHKEEVEIALSKGKSVPDEVLKDYPDPAVKYKRK